jgi:signal transduction histidine kinase
VRAAANRRVVTSGTLQGDGREIVPPGSRSRSGTTGVPLGRTGTGVPVGTSLRSTTTVAAAVASLRSVSAPSVPDRAVAPWLLPLRALRAAAWGAGPGDDRWARAGRRHRVAPWVLGVLGVALAVAAGGSEFTPDRGFPAVGGFLLALPGAVALGLAARRPLDAWRIATLWVLVLPFVLPPPVTGSVPPLEWWVWVVWVPVLFAAAWAAPAVATLGVGLLSGLVVAVLVLVGPWPVAVGALPLSLLAVAVPVLLGVLLAARQDAGVALAREQERRATVQAERGALAERTRIAREMHDIVAHHMSMIAVRCETAPYRLTGLDGPAAEEFGQVAGAAREALSEMQTLLGVLRADDQPGARTPQPGLADVERLLADTADAGTDVRWSLVTGPVPDQVGLSAFRIVQQSLANAAQHAPGAPVRVRVAADGPAVEIEVVNGPGTGRGRPGGGTGVAGMRERAELHGGRLDAVPSGDGGFAVRATLPLDAGEPR